MSTKHDAAIPTPMPTFRVVNVPLQTYEEMRRKELVHDDLVEALKGVIRVADRATVEFDAARAALVKAAA
jgi:hypothetical protein